MVESASPKYGFGRRAAVIGSGLGGLAAAVRLAAAAVVERNDCLGGRAGAWTETR